MTRDAYVFMRQYIHLADNATRKSKGEIGYHALFKVKYALDIMMEGMKKSWTAGKHVTIDESMIRYMGRAISYVQYMPDKPIKHGIKVFALCCAFSAVILAFKVYIGKEDDTDGTTVGVCNDLCIDAGLTESRGRVLYTDNYYTSVKLAKHMFNEYGWTIVGTISPTDKKSRADEDIPFLKLSNGARNGVKRGWFREAVIKLKAKSGKHYYIQCTTWRDKKQVCFLSNNDVGSSSGLSLLRHVKGKLVRICIDGPRARQDYAKYFNAVDRNDRDSADYSTSIRTNRYYIRIFCWVLDRVVHTCFAVVLYCVNFGIARDEWKKYASKNIGRHDFQIDLGIALLNHGLGLDWDGDERPDYVRVGELVPCNCNKCYFCINGYTSGIAHKKRARVTVVYKCNTRVKTDKCTEMRVNLNMGGDVC